MATQIPRPSTGRIVGGVLLSILLTFALIFMMIFIATRWMTRKDTVSTALQKQDITELELAIGDTQDPQTVPELLRTSFPPEFMEAMHLDSEKLNVYLKRSTWMTFIADSLGAFVQDMADGTSTMELSSETFMKEFEKNEPVLKDVTGQDLDPRFKEALTQEFANKGTMSTQTILDPSTRDSLKILQPMTSQMAIILFAVAVLILTGGIILLMRGKLPWFAPNLAIPLIVTGLFILVARFILESTFKQALAQARSMDGIFEPILNHLTSRSTLVSIIMIVLGLVLLIVGLILRGRSRRDVPPLEPSYPNPYQA